MFQDIQPCKSLLVIDEVWHDIEGFEGKYQISNLGRVKSLNYHKEHREVILVQVHNPIAKNDAPIVNLRGDNKNTYRFRVHTLVGKYFVPNPKGLKHLVFIDGDRSNCMASNLKWAELTETDDLRRIVLTIKGKEYVTNNFVSRDGYLYREDSTEIIRHHNQHGYFAAALNYGHKKHVTRLVHRLVAQAFIPNPENKPEVNHINGIKDDPRAENLEWVTPKENTAHAIRTGLTILRDGSDLHRGYLEHRDEILRKQAERMKGTGNAMAKLTDDDVIAIRQMYADGMTLKDIYTKMQLRRQQVSDIVMGITWKHLPIPYEVPNGFRNSVLQMKDGKVIQEFASVGDAAKSVGGNWSAISACCNGRRKHHRGYEWEYK